MRCSVFGPIDFRGLVFFSLKPKRKAIELIFNGFLIIGISYLARIEKFSSAH